jgi:hypothetical protein
LFIFRRLFQIIFLAINIELLSFFITTFCIPWFIIGFYLPVIKAAKNLKNSKAPGLDDIINEYLKTTVTKCLPYYVKLFNLIFDSGESPDSWTLGISKAIYKNKGDPNDPDNYRAISLVTLPGKLFTSILSSRLSNFSDETDLESNVYPRNIHTT